MCSGKPVIIAGLGRKIFGIIYTNNVVTQGTCKTYCDFRGRTWMKTDDPETGDIYAGLDRFGRIKDCRWYNTDADEDAVRLKYGYDRDSNRLWRQDDIARSLSQNFDELYTYDGLQRLKTFGRGTLNIGHSSLSDVQYQQCWDLDSTENWTGMKQAESGTTWTLEQARTANTVNEITDIINAVGPIWSVPAYDPAGNMTTIPQSEDPSESFTATWDAWNRLVKLIDTSTSHTVAEYQYDAQNRRILKKLYTNGTLSQTRHIYVSNSNQVLEERVDSSASAAQQNIWGLQYIDGLILRDRDTTGSGTLNERRYCLQDANWNTVALTDETGTIIQRFAYQPFGTCEFLEADYDPGTNTSYWTTLFTGRELDLESKLYYFRARYFSGLLGVFQRRDPSGYRDGTGLYAAVFIPNATDPTGMQLDDPFNQAPSKDKNKEKPPLLDPNDSTSGGIYVGTPFGTNSEIVTFPPNPGKAGGGCSKAAAVLGNAKLISRELSGYGCDGTTPLLNGPLFELAVKSITSFTIAVNQQCPGGQKCCPTGVEQRQKKPNTNWSIPLPTSSATCFEIFKFQGDLVVFEQEGACKNTNCPC